MIDRIRVLARSRAFEVGGTVLGLALIGWVLREALEDTADLRFSLAPAVLAMIGFALSWLGLSLAWTVLSTGRLDRPQSARWLRSQLLRYIPGAVWAPMSRFVDMEGDRASRAKLLVIEVLAILTTTSLLAGIAAGLAIDRGWFVLGAGGFAGTIVVAITSIRSGRSVAQVCAWLGLTSTAVGSYVVASGWSQHAVGPGLPFWTAASAGLLGWLAGYVVIVAPGGLGAKEWVYVALLPTSASSSAAAGVLAARVLFVAGELTVVCGAMLFDRRCERRCSIGGPAFDRHAQRPHDDHS